MNDSNQPEIGFLIELAITGQADEQQFEEVMNRVENEPEVAALYKQALAEHEFLEAQIPAAEQKLTNQQSEEQAQAARQEEEERRRQQENDLGLGM